MQSVIGLTSLMATALILLGTTPTFAASTPEPVDDPDEPVRIGRFGEAPMLAALVAAGELPPVEERLPIEPSVLVAPEIGRYGGTANVFALDESPWNDLMANPELGRYILQFSADGSITGDNAKGYDLNDDRSSLTIHLREGTRWSDGEPFTADDIVFRFEDMNWNEQVRTLNVYPEVTSVTKIDDDAIRLGSDGPNPRIIMKMATWQGGNWTAFAPKHYLSQWHILYNDNAEARAREEGFENWWEALAERDGASGTKYVDNPTLHPWKLVSRNSHVFERNAYYWRVDKAANQLPYIDRVESRVVDQEVYTLKIFSGEATIAYTHTTLDSVVLLKQNEERGGYKVTLIPDFITVSLALNLNHTTPWRAQLYQDERFRHALSLAINREEFNEIVYLGLGTPRQSTPIWTVSKSDYNPEWERAYAGYDPDEANGLLDEIGLTKRDADGFRWGFGEEPLVLVIDYREGTFRDDSLELIKEYWQQIGIKVKLRSVLRGEFSNLSWEKESNDHDARALPVNSEEIFEFTWGAPYHSCFQSQMPENSWRPCGAQFNWAFDWGKWIAAHNATMANFDHTMPGIEPPEAIKTLDVWTREWVNTDFGSDEYLDLATKIFNLQAAKLWTIGVVGEAVIPLAASKVLGNVPTAFMPGTGHPVSLSFYGDQLFFK